MAKILSIAVGVVGVGGVLALVLTGEGESHTRELSELVASVDARLTEVAAGVHARVSTLANLPRLAAAVSTDAATVADLTQSELAFRTRPDETIEIGQVSMEGKPTTLASSPTALLPPSQSRVDI